MTDEQIIAYVDGELGPIEALRFERTIAADPEIAAEVERHSRLREAVAGHFATVADEPLPDRLRGLLNGSSNVVAFPARPRAGSGGAARYAALAATLVAGLAVGQLLPRAVSEPSEGRGGAIVAQGELAQAFDSQLASAAPGRGAYRMGVSFRSTDDRYCRTFSAATGAGIGCHGRDGWTLERFIAGAQVRETGAYRQAGSEAAEIQAAAQEMMAGSPLDAAQERQAKARGWSTRHD